MLCFQSDPLGKQSKIVLHKDDLSEREDIKFLNRPHAAAKKCKMQLTRSHNALVKDGIAKAGQCLKSKKRNIYKVLKRPRSCPRVQEAACA